jgi:hypothetical protein
VKVWPSSAICVHVSTAGTAEAVEDRSQYLALPGAGSALKKVVVHWPEPVTIFWTHLPSQPNRTVCVPVTEKAAPSLAIRIQPVVVLVTACAVWKPSSAASESTLEVSATGSTSVADGAVDEPPPPQPPKARQAAANVACQANVFSNFTSSTPNIQV